MKQAELFPGVSQWGAPRPDGEADGVLMTIAEWTRTAEQYDKLGRRDVAAYILAHIEGKRNPVYININSPNVKNYAPE